MVDKKQNKQVILGIVSPGDQKVHEMELWKTDNYLDFTTEISKIWKIKQLKVVPVVIGALGALAKRIDN